MSTRVRLLLGVGLLALVALVVWSRTHTTREGEVSYSEGGVNAEEQARVEITAPGVRVSAEVVDTPESRTQGLSGRATLEQGEGMLFVFPRPEPRAFWMPDMHFSIDIIWIDETLEVVHVTYGATPESYPENFTSVYPAMYVLEVPAGYAQAHRIERGTVFTFTPRPVAVL